MENLYLIGFAQALFFVVLILTKKNKILSDYFLAFFILLIGGQLFWVYSYYSGFFTNNPWIIIVDIYYWALLGPTLFVYTKIMTNGRKHLNWKYLLLLLPTFMVTIGFAEYIFIDGSNFFSEMYSKDWFYNLSVYVWFYNAPLFYVIIIVLLIKHNKRIKQYYSYSKNIDLKWLIFLTNGFMFFLFAILFKSYITKILNIEFPSSLYYTWPVMVLYVFGIGFFGYRQKGVFSQIDITETKPARGDLNIFKLKTSEKALYKKSGLNKEEAEKLSKSLLSLMIDEKPYLDEELSLVILAKKLGTSTHKLSQVINENFSKNFFEFINDYRLDEVKTKLSDPDNNKYKIISIAYDCGFNTKSTFYALFKKNTSLTPAEFRSKYQKKAV